MILVGIHGKGGSGKDTVGEILRDKHGFGSAAFANPIKRMICCLLDVGLAKWNDREWREAPLELFGNKSPRFMAQTIGTEWGRRTIDPDLWLNLTMNKIKAVNWDKVAITDVRFDNEAEYIRDHGGFIIHVHRDESDLHENAQAHDSEVGLSVRLDDFHINNYGTLEDLEAQVSDVVEQIFSEEEKKIEEVHSDVDDSPGTDNRSD